MQGHILIVEDEEAIAAFVQTALEREGFSVQWVNNGLAALKAVDTAAPDLIVLDLMLPGLDGLQVCQLVRQREQYIPIIMLTARAGQRAKPTGPGRDVYVPAAHCPVGATRRVVSAWRRNV